MRWLKDQIPTAWRLRYQLARRRWQDRQQGGLPLLATIGNELPLANFQINATQVIRPSSYFDNKVHNLQLAAASINQIVILPGQIFSYWHTVGAPSPARGFREGRNLINGQLKADYGGGLCQLSGIIYLLALRAAFPVLERHHHSVDIYTEAERYCPLGADATVVYGYKDFRFQNKLTFPVALQLRIVNHQLQASLYAAEELVDFPVEFVREEEGKFKRVRTVRQKGDVMEELSESVYRFY